MIRLYNFPHGARGVRVAWVCEEMGLPYETVPVAYPPDDSYRSLNPLGTVPLLVENDLAIAESVAIILYLAETHGPTPLLPSKGDPSYAAVLELTIFAEATLGACLNPLLAARFGAPDEDSRNWSVTNLEARVDRLLTHVSDRLGANAYLVGAGLTLADIAVETALRIWQGALRKTVPDNLAAYRQRLSALPAYQRAVKAQS